MKAFFYNLVSAFFILVIFVGVAGFFGVRASDIHNSDRPWFLAGFSLAALMGTVLLVWTRISRAKWLLDRAVKESADRYFTETPEGAALFSRDGKTVLTRGPGGHGLWLTSLKFDALSLVLVVVLLGGSFTALGALNMGDLTSIQTIAVLAGSLTVTIAGAVPLVLVRKARARWLAGVAIYESFAFFQALARDRAGKVRDAVAVAKGEGIFGQAVGQARDRDLITPAVVFYSQLQTRRSTGELSEEDFRTAVNDLLTNEIAFRRRARAGGEAV